MSNKIKIYNYNFHEETWIYINDLRMYIVHDKYILIFGAYFLHLLLLILIRI